MQEDTKIGNQPAAIIEHPSRKIVLQDGLGEEWTVAWVKLSTAFKPHIKKLRGSPLAVWLYISLSINRQGISFPSIAKIAEDTGYSHQGVLDAINTLEDNGYLKVRRGERRYNLYEPEFAAIGRSKEPSETVNLVESTELSQVLPANESTFSPNESSPLDSNKNNKSQLEAHEKRKTPLPAGSDIAFQMAAGMTSQEIADTNTSKNAENDLLIEYERAMGYSSLDWYGNDLERLRRFILTKPVHEIQAFAKWSKRQFSTFDPSKARLKPNMVIDLWPQAQVKQQQPVSDGESYLDREHPL